MAFAESEFDNRMVRKIDLKDVDPRNAGPNLVPALRASTLPLFHVANQEFLFVTTFVPVFGITLTTFSNVQKIPAMDFCFSVVPFVSAWNAIDFVDAASYLLNLRFLQPLHMPALQAEQLVMATFSLWISSKNNSTELYASLLIWLLDTRPAVDFIVRNDPCASQQRLAAPSAA